MFSGVFCSRISCGCRVSSWRCAVRNSFATHLGQEISLKGRAKYGSHTARAAALEFVDADGAGIPPARSAARRCGGGRRNIAMKFSASQYWSSLGRGGP